MNASILSIFEACSAATGRSFRHPQHGTSTKCPIHDDRTASLSVNESKGTFYCFAGSCAIKGGVLDVPVAFGIAKDRKEAAKWLSERGLIPKAQSTGFRTITAPNRVYTNPKALSVDMRVWRHFALEDLRVEIGDLRLRTVRDHIAEMRYEREKKDGDGTALLRCMAAYEASKRVSDPSVVVALARDTFPQFFVNDPLEAA
jgi:hypothetical protein